jgi:glycopeptide antibiotics resistance protein
VLPVVIPVATAVLALMLWSLRRNRRLTALRGAVAVVLCVYVAGVLANTVFPIYTDKPTGTAPWSNYLALVPFTDYEVADAAMNMLVFAPVGVLVPLLVARAGWGTVVVVSAVVSLAIEVTQYATAHLLGGGHIADVNDILSNVAGGVVGFAVFAVLVRVPPVSAVVDRFRWRGADPAVPPSPSLEMGQEGFR